MQMETMEHQVNECKKMTKDSERITEILDKSGEGVEWMKVILARRKKKENVRIREEQLKHGIA